MQLTQIRTFIAIARECNLTRAANALHLSQSAISSQLKSLEEEFGIRLFIRGSRGMTLSEQGRLLLGHAKDIEVAVENLSRRAQTLSQKARTSLTIGLNTDPTFLKISDINRRLSLLHPDLNIIFHASDTAGTAQRLHSGQLDLGFFYGELNDPAITCKEITQVRTCVVIPHALADSKRKLEWDDLLTLPWIWVDDKFPFYRALSRKLDGAHKRPERIVTAANEQIVRELVTSGQGVALVREDEAEVLRAQGSVTVWEKGWGVVPLRLGWLKKNSKLPHIEAAQGAINYVWHHRTLEHPETLADKVWL